MPRPLGPVPTTHLCSRVEQRHQVARQAAVAGLLEAVQHQVDEVETGGGEGGTKDLPFRKFSHKELPLSRCCDDESLQCIMAISDNRCQLPCPPPPYSGPTRPNPSSAHPPPCEQRGRQVDVLRDGQLRVVARADGVGARQHGAARVEGGYEAGLGHRNRLLLHGLVKLLCTGRGGGGRYEGRAGVRGEPSAQTQPSWGSVRTLTRSAAPWPRGAGGWGEGKGCRAGQGRDGFQVRDPSTKARTRCSGCAAGGHATRPVSGPR